MMELLPIGSVVTINNDENKTKLMIISVFPLKNENGKVGYYDYASCLYPYGLVNDQYFFRFLLIFLKVLMLLHH